MHITKQKKNQNEQIKKNTSNYSNTNENAKYDNESQLKRQTIQTTANKFDYKNKFVRTNQIDT